MAAAAAAGSAGQGRRTRVAVFSGPTATLLNTAPLVTSDHARRRHGLPPRPAAGRFDVLRPQRLAVPVTVYIEAYSAHPLERDAAHLYAPPDGYVDAAGNFSEQQRHHDDVPVYVAELRPEDGLYLLPYMARQSDGSAWEAEGVSPMASPETNRQTFFPDAARLVEEIDRFGLGDDGRNGLVESRAELAFFRPVPSGGYLKGLDETLRTDEGEGDIPPERWGEDFFPYTPRHLAAGPRRTDLAHATNAVHGALGSGAFDGMLWIEGSPVVEETMYWLNLTIDTSLPLCGIASQRRHGTIGSEGDRNLIDGLEYVRSGVWRGADGADRLGAVLVVDQRIFSARDASKVDARPGGYTVTGGHGGVVGGVGGPGGTVVTYVPDRRHTSSSEVNLSRLPRAVRGVSRRGGALVAVEVPVKDADGALLPAAVPKVTTCKYLRYGVEDDHGSSSDVEIEARVAENHACHPLAGFVLEGNSPFGRADPPMTQALRRAALSGQPVVSVGRGSTQGFAARREQDLVISGSNLTVHKARLLLMACLLRFGAPPPAADPAAPSDAEERAVLDHIRRIQHVFDTH